MIREPELRRNDAVNFSQAVEYHGRCVGIECPEGGSAISARCPETHVEERIELLVRGFVNRFGAAEARDVDPVNVGAAATKSSWVEGFWFGNAAT
jgi:hypothetical protein